MPIGLRGLSNDVRVGAGIADVIRSQQDVAVEEQQQLQLLQQQRLVQQLQETVGGCGCNAMCSSTCNDDESGSS